MQSCDSHSPRCFIATSVDGWARWDWPPALGRGGCLYLASLIQFTHGTRSAGERPEQRMSWYCARRYFRASTVVRVRVRNKPDVPRLRSTQLGRAQYNTDLDDSVHSRPPCPIGQTGWREVGATTAIVGRTCTALTQLARACFNTSNPGVTLPGHGSFKPTQSLP